MSPGGVQGAPMQTVSLQKRFVIWQIAPFFIFPSKELFMHITVAM